MKIKLKFSNLVWILTVLNIFLISSVSYSSVGASVQEVINKVFTISGLSFVIKIVLGFSIMLHLYTGSMKAIQGDNDAAAKEFFMLIFSLILLLSINSIVSAFLGFSSRAIG